MHDVGVSGLSFQDKCERIVSFFHKPTLVSALKATGKATSHSFVILPFPSHRAFVSPVASTNTLDRNSAWFLVNQVLEVVCHTLL